MKAGALLKDKKVIAGIILVVILAVAFATAQPADDDDKKSGSSEEDAVGEKQWEIETFDFSGVASGIVGYGMNGVHTFEVREGAEKVIVNLSGEELVGVEDLDLDVEGAEGGKSTSGNSNSQESVIISHIDIVRRFKYGDYTATAVAYAAFLTSYDMHVEVWYPANATT